MSAEFLNFSVGKPGVPLDDFSVGHYHPGPNGEGDPKAVLVKIPAPSLPGPMAGATFFLRLKSMRAVRELCDAIMENARECWPEEAR